MKPTSPTPLCLEEGQLHLTSLYDNVLMDATSSLLLDELAQVLELAVLSKIK